MTFHPLDWHVPETWLVAALLLALLVVPMVLIGQQKGISIARKSFRMALNSLLWLAVLGVWLQPRWQQTLPPGRLLLAADNVPADYVRSTATSLGVRTVLTATAFRALKTDLPVDTVWLLGQVPEQVLARLSRQWLVWRPYNVPGQLQDIRWKGIVRVGEQQSVYGKINIGEGAALRLKFGQEVVDSTALPVGDQPFKLTYPVFSKGRTSVTLWLGTTLLDTLRFFARPAPALRVRFVLDAPDFETRTLADWLGRQGNAVDLTSRLSKGVGSELTINKTAAGTLLDLVITDPENVDNLLIKRTVASGKSVLVLNLTHPETDVPTINRAVGTRFEVRRIPGKDTLRLAPNLTALPFRFQPSPAALPVAGYPVMVQPRGGRVAVSLLAETFPLRLSGDSTAYARLWQSVLAQLRPTGADNVLIDAPVFQYQPARFRVNNAGTLPAQFRVGPDTLMTRPDPVNARSYAATGRFAKTGWLSVQDTLAIYVYGDVPEKTPPGLAAVARREQTAAWVRAHRRYDAAASRVAQNRPRIIEKAIPDWGWLLVIGLLLSALWGEVKVR